ncbi:CheY-like chemotaxis protein [Neorhizobium huautlense]|uniref:CheY-like chemotaxis protein n=1 Tax=Neorhizobium huautlense TaxID=67774 RepID=A0ABT9Q3G9_9HYPH|nr:response regulator [Neorhizobium huautlense]MDP9840504.1 CheY-like chemotaxis protein [Neorhizobium huautlense]
MNATILVVEDDGLIRMDLADTLTDQGFKVLEAGNADEAFEIMEQNALIHALITDIDMPGSMNGLELARHVAEIRPDCAITVISGRYSPSQGALPAKARFLSKPVSEEAVAQTLAELGVG